MSKSIRIRTTPGESKNIQIKVEQDFDFLEIMSLKIDQEDLYTSFCANYGVVIGRVIANKGLGVPNSKISVFVPITSEDEKNELIKDLYPFKEVTSKNKNNVRYNLLLSKSTCELNTPVGTFPTKEELLNNDIMIEVFEKYYKYTTKTNDAGDYMLFGVPTGQQTIHMDVDLSETGPFSVRPYDFIDNGFSEKLFVSRTKYKTSENLNDLPQIKSGNKGVDVVPFWGDEEQCQIGITRVDFDTNFKFEPTSILMGSIFTDNGKNSVSKSCDPTNDQGLHGELKTGPGYLETIRVSEYMYSDDIPTKNSKIIPLSLEEFALPQGTQSIDDEGVFVVTVPMNLDHVITDEFGELIPSGDPEKGIATKGMYRFKLKFLEASTGKYRTAQLIFPSLNRDTGGDEIDTKKYIGIPSTSITPAQPYQPGLNDPLKGGNTTENVRWSDDLNVWKMVTSTSNVVGSTPTPSSTGIRESFYKDFHQFEFNQIYSISQYITKYKKGGKRFSFLGLKDIDESTFNVFPMTTIIKGRSTWYSVLKSLVRIQIMFLRVLTVLSSFVFYFKMNLEIFGITFADCAGIFLRPFGFLKSSNTPYLLDCASDSSFPMLVESWQCTPPGYTDQEFEDSLCEGCDAGFCLRVGFASPVGIMDQDFVIKNSLGYSPLLVAGECLGDAAGTNIIKKDGIGRVTHFACPQMCALNAYLCCVLFDLAKDADILNYAFFDAWLTGAAYLPQFEYKSKLKGDSTTRDKFCGPGGDQARNDNYKKQRCCGQGGGGFGFNSQGVDCDKCLFRGPTSQDSNTNNQSVYHQNNYKTGASDINDILMCPENYPTKIVNLGRTDACPDIINRIDRCIESSKCLLNLFESTSQNGCPATISVPEPIATEACFTGTYFMGGYDSEQWVNDFGLTSYQDPAAVILELMTDCGKGVKQLFNDDTGSDNANNCGLTSNKCKECELNSDVWIIIREISKIYTEIIMSDPTVNGLTQYDSLLADIPLAAKFNPSAPGGVDTDQYLGDRFKLNHLANSPYFYFGLYAGRTAIDKLRKDYLSEI